MDQVVVSDTETFSEANEKPLLLELQCSSKGSRWLNQDFAIRDEGIWKKGSILWILATEVETLNFADFFWEYL